MSLRRKAAITAVFGYLQVGVSIVTGFFLVPLTLHTIGARTWGVWLASGEVLAYAGMTDLGMLGVMQWLIAEAEGRKDRREMSELVSQGVWLGAAVAIVFLAVAIVLWHVLPSALFLSAADRAAVERPLLLAIVLTAITYPLLSYRALLVGVQDASFVGTVSLVSAAVSAAVLGGMLLGGYGLYALVISSGGGALVTTVVFVARAAVSSPDVVFRLSPPRLRYLRSLLANGVGTWLGNVGWQTLAATNGVLITYLGHPEWVAVYACTSKLAGVSQSMTWILPDSAHVSLAQLYGEGAKERVRDVIMLMQRMHLVLGGLVAAGLLAFNAVFVTRWVGPQLFAGVMLNVLIAAGVIFHSYTHGLVTSASIAGNRPRVGVLVLVNGIVQLPLAIFLGHRAGLNGVVVAGLIASAVTSLPGSLWLMRDSTGVRARPMWAELVAPWLMRALPILVVAGAVGAFYQSLGISMSGIAATIVCLAYVWYLRRFYAEAVPSDPRWTPWLRRLRLLPPPPIVTAVVGSSMVEHFETPR